MKFKHYANIDDKGKLILSNRDQFLNDLQQLKGKNVYVVVDEEKQTRSNNQNRYYWSCIIQPISDYTGYTPDEVHEILLDKFADKKEVKIKDETHLIPMRSHKMKTDSFEKYVEQIRVWASTELGLRIALPNEVLTEG